MSLYTFEKNIYFVYIHIQNFSEQMQKKDNVVIWENEWWWEGAFIFHFVSSCISGLILLPDSYISLIF